MKSDRALKLLTEPEPKQLNQDISRKDGLWDGGLSHVLLYSSKNSLSDHLLSLPQQWQLPETNMFNRIGLHPRNSEPSRHSNLDLTSNEVTAKGENRKCTTLQYLGFEIF